MESRDRISIQEAILGRQLSWISAADSKVAFTFALNTAMLGLLATVSPKSIPAWTTGGIVWSTITGLLTAASLISLTFAAFPRTEGPKSSVIYSAGIGQRSAEQYHQAVLGLTVDSYLADLTAQCHRNAEIANTKFMWIKRAMVALHISVVPWVFAVWFLYSSAGH